MQLSKGHARTLVLAMRGPKELFAWCHAAIEAARKILADRHVWVYSLMSSKAARRCFDPVGIYTPDVCTCRVIAIVFHHSGYREPGESELTVKAKLYIRDMFIVSA
jgi:hypothetical protein